MDIYSSQPETNKGLRGVGWQAVPWDRRLPRVDKGIEMDLQSSPPAGALTGLQHRRHLYYGSQPKNGTKCLGGFMWVYVGLGGFGRQAVLWDGWWLDRGGQVDRDGRLSLNPSGCTTRPALQVLVCTYT